MAHQLSISNAVQASVYATICPWLVMLDIYSKLLDGRQDTQMLDCPVKMQDSWQVSLMYLNKDHYFSSFNPNT